MAFWRSKGALLVTSALVAGGAVTSNSGGTTRGKVFDLLDPAAIAASACGMGQNTAFKPTQVAPATSAEAIAAGAGPPLWQGLGTLSHPITTGSEHAQRYFRSGPAPDLCLQPCRGSARINGSPCGFGRLLRRQLRFDLSQEAHGPRHRLGHGGHSLPT
jgi:hypothetical protein